MVEYQKFMDSLVEFMFYLLKLGVPILVSYLAYRWGDLKIKILELNKKQEQAWIVRELVEFAVMGVEQAYKTGVVKDKKAEAIIWLQDRLTERHINIDLKELDLLIEAIVIEKKNLNEI